MHFCTKTKFLYFHGSIFQLGKMSKYKLNLLLALYCKKWNYPPEKSTWKTIQFSSQKLFLKGYKRLLKSFSEKDEKYGALWAISVIYTLLIQFFNHKFVTVGGSNSEVHILQNGSFLKRQKLWMCTYLNEVKVFSFLTKLVAWNWCT